MPAAPGGQKLRHGGPAAAVAPDGDQRVASLLITAGLIPAGKINAGEITTSVISAPNASVELQLVGDAVFLANDHQLGNC